MKATELQYSTREINRNFKIKVYGYTEEGAKVDTLVGVSGLILLIGVELANKQIERAYKSGKDKCVCKLRRGLKVTYYVH
jgi:hypothetical protein